MACGYSNNSRWWAHCENITLELLGTSHIFATWVLMRFDIFLFYLSQTSCLPFFPFLWKLGRRRKQCHKCLLVWFLLFSFFAPNCAQGFPPRETTKNQIFLIWGVIILGSKTPVSWWQKFPQWRFTPGGLLLRRPSVNAPLLEPWRLEGLAGSVARSRKSARKSRILGSRRAKKKSARAMREMQKSRAFWF